MCAHPPAWAPRSPGRGPPRDGGKGDHPGSARGKRQAERGRPYPLQRMKSCPACGRGGYTAKDRHPDKGLKAIARFSSFAAEPGLGRPAAACTPHPAPGGAQGWRRGAAFQVDAARPASSSARLCRREPRCMTKQDKVANPRTPAPHQPGSRGGGKKGVPEQAVEIGNGTDSGRHRRQDTARVTEVTERSAG